MGAQIKSESPLNPLQVQTGQTTVVPLAAGPGGPQPQGGPPPAVMLVNKMAPNCDKRAADTAYWMASEGGFINSQPSMAEFLNHLSPESPKIGTPVSVGVGVGGVVGGAGSGAGGYPVGVGVGVPQTPDGMDSVPEYPWMKEKKTSRKSSNNNNQGKYLRQDEEPQSRTGKERKAQQMKRNCSSKCKTRINQEINAIPAATSGALPIPVPVPIPIPLTLDSNKSVPAVANLICSATNCGTHAMPQRISFFFSFCICVCFFGFGSFDGTGPWPGPKGQSGAAKICYLRSFVTIFDVDSSVATDRRTNSSRAESSRVETPRDDAKTSSFP